ncbi:MAG TPA: CHAD domain-containing protein, partial [Longimicrobiales bacterium]|nr:CHAD domain-containing protein [Longimicrobiales bacterium]
ESFRAANVPFRDAGRLLASARDADVARETVDRLRELDGGTSAELALVGLRERLAARGRSVLARAVAAGGSVGEAKEQIRRAGEDVDGWPVDDLDFPGVRAGFLEVYGRGRREMAEALRRPEGPLFHEWRKRVKYFWYHTRLVTPCWPGVGSSTEPQQDLSDLLGDANDLSDLLRLLDEDDDRGLGSPAAREVVRILAVRRRGELWAQARSLGRSLYAEAPDALGARMDEEWRGMRLEGRRG